MIKDAKFVVSNTDITKCPEDGKPEYAFIGRSNVGKSSLINMLTDRKNLAKTSGTPGKTQLINHFVINDDWYLVDLPGYGYARTSKSNRSKWEQFISEYLTQRSTLINIFVLLDSRLEPQKIDLEFMTWCAEEQLPFSIVFTKIDKLSSSALQKNLAAYKKEMLKQWAEMPPVFTTSAESKFGREKLLNYIGQINMDLKQTEQFGD
ncbi:MAG: YihA family ribosome biogenesis GTP-binding protein [Candidatus Fluviicola riflensis]|nr:MAG: YihA family ribosome biogenesis GTP-binding protein [Candidatus Fluviicola riflensis]OGS76950.1 MAG: YihA family ribosome biogenesis GTP-binding protein [Candidatus Fluviicola riflensis]OGS83098.1 MAG: YihA family ribosome biogenesis GTP-binding protein [Fluviicola sp. RIFCSPHIGHO2_01_FULL_43_53]OGS88678.1 MAG: YihA family ribosome biogenesis GTP-binding protein [Fluviicola sp. RIFCSPHIGHO2_12_FULL_43_24]